MKFVKRSLTKNLVAPVQGPLNPAVVDLLEGGDEVGADLVIGALVRSVVMGISVKGSRSVTARGTTAIFFTPSGTSKLWLESNDLLAWTITQGVTKERPDWALKIDFSKDQVSIVTSAYLTVNEEIAHRERYEVLRRELLRALALGRLDDGASDIDIEGDASAASLAMPQGFSDQSPTDELLFTILTTEPLEEILNIIDNSGLVVLSRAETTRAVRVGPVLQTSNGLVRNGLILNCGNGRIEGQGALGSEESPGKQRLDAISAKASIELLVKLLRAKGDPSAHFVGPSCWCSV